MGCIRIPTSAASPFYGYPAKVIAEWCGVSVGTAKHYKSGLRPPPTPVLRLFRLYKDNKVLGREWDGFRARGDKLYGANNQFITPSLIELNGLLWQALAEEDNEKYHQLLEKVVDF